jgi:hypothetical protein
MEAKRLHASQRKEEEKTRALEAEKRKREEGEKRKREEAPPLSKSVVKGKKPTPVGFLYHARTILLRLTHYLIVFG